MVTADPAAGADRPTTVRPANPDEAARVLREAAAAGHRLAFAGARTAAGWGGRLAPVDVVVDTGGLDRVVDWQPDDLTVVVQAGTPLRSLQGLLRERGQRVAFDAARVAAGATVGGLLATADDGPSRLAYGTLRDLVIGVTVVRADGVVARAGGRVIKNVAGYDLARLFSGSLGTLGLVVEVVLRLHPLPPATATLTVRCDPPTAHTLAGRLVDAALEPTALEWHAGRLLARFEGTPEGLAARRRHAATLLPAPVDWRVVPDPGTWDALTGGWREVSQVATGAAGDTVLRVVTRPSAGPALLDRVRRAADEIAAGQRTPRQPTADDRTAAGRHADRLTVDLTCGLATGVHRVRVRGGAARQHAELVTAARRAVEAAGGAVTVCRWADGLPDLVPAWGAPPPSVGLLRAVKRAFDPDGRLGPGRFAPWF